VPEIPERKVLKEMLKKMKAKVIESEKNVLLLSASMNESMTKDVSKSHEIAKGMPDVQTKTVSLLLVSVFDTWRRNFDLLNTTINALIGDIDLYIETLERYSIELDSTLTNIFEEAKKMAEEQRKKQEELMKKKPPESYRI